MDNTLGDFLRARRERVTPAEAGVPPGHGLRRVTGLRREEVAMLAGISAEYYLRLEQGRDRNPSAQVLQALAKVLQLDNEGTAYLMSLAAPKPRRGPDRPDELLTSGLELLLQTLNVPAFVFNKYGDVLAANRLAQALSPEMAPGTNRLRALFTDHAAQEYHTDWEQYTATAVAHLRAQVGTETDDERLQSLIGELSLKSDRFRQLWARHDVHSAHEVTFRIEHPQVGILDLLVEKFQVIGAIGLEMMLLHVEPGTRSADALALLASLNAHS
ncbi:XRE family transcriptional regulator [Streptomyces sp. PRh5]|uniref:Helix-turn-helix domain protein n=1 Tax=Streptomyces violaceusniger (strain Tu 4113) TaxID=653045 RepID=G2P0I2_STRV4|nr:MULTISPECIES: helix-turn-helix transcriptional regulator [Streptomyces]AEM85980.1 helix-turn-helix domain protein [Streptomyces violaceusniger Tu 4113]EXU67218.1 XRE family transcriptional regulator [Streptomyces sp. PRh5]